MQTVWKLTDPEGWTRRGTSGETLWIPCPVERSTAGGGIAKLCTEAYTHAYADPILAEWFDPVHGEYGDRGLLVQGEAGGIVDDGMKLGCEFFRSLEVVPRAGVPLAAKVRAGIECSLLVYAAPAYVTWAQRWLDGTDRSKPAARSAAMSAAEVVVRAQPIDCLAILRAAIEAES